MNIEDLKKLAGVNEFTGYTPFEFKTVSVEDKKKIEKEKGIKPGDPEWFKLWVPSPSATGFRGRKR